MLTIEDVEDICLLLDSKEESGLCRFQEGYSNALKDILFLCGLGLTLEEIEDKITFELGEFDIEDVLGVYDIGYYSALETLLERIEDGTEDD